MALCGNVTAVAELVSTLFCHFVPAHTLATMKQPHKIVA